MKLFFCTMSWKRYKSIVVSIFSTNQEDTKIIHFTHRILTKKIVLMWWSLNKKIKLKYEWMKMMNEWKDANSCYFGKILFNILCGHIKLGGVKLSQKARLIWSLRFCSELSFRNYYFLIVWSRSTMGGRVYYVGLNCRLMMMLFRTN